MSIVGTTISPQSIVNRYADFVTATANSNLAWNRENLPFPEFDPNFFNSGVRSVGITGSNIDVAGNLITPNNIYNALLTETATYTNLRNLRALMFVGGGGGNTGSRPSPGFAIDSTRKSHFTTAYRQPINPVTQQIATGQDITAANLEALFARLRDAYVEQSVNTITVQVDVCHASCHSSCHSSRGRR
jgi:hypothetical protein